MKLVKSYRLIVFLTLISCCQHSFGQWQADQVPRNAWPASLRGKSRSMASLAVIEFNADKKSLNFDERAGSPSLTLPLSTGESFDFELKESSPLVPSFGVFLSSGKKYTQPLPIFYTGSVKNKKRSQVALIKTNQGWEGSFYVEEEHWTIGKVRDVKGGQHVVFRTSEETDAQPIPCLGEVEASKPSNTKKARSMGPQALATCRSVQVFLETDFFTYQAWGSNTSYVVQQLLATFHQVSQLYAQDGILLQLSGLKIWDTPEPWNSSMSPTGILSSVQSYYNDQPTSFPGTLHHFVTAKSIGGGVAYIYSDVSVYENMPQRAVFGFDEKSFAFGVSGNISDQIVSLPNYSWTVNVIAHEIGHNFGLPHTHSCSWPGGAIDDCGPSRGYPNENGSCTNGPTPTNGGTIMSYCHLVGGVGVNFANGFGPLPKAKMLAEVNAAPQLVSGVAAPLVTSVSTCETSGSFQLVAGGCANGTYRWYSQATGGSLVASGSIFQTPVLSTTTSYFVDCTLDDCGVSPRAQATVSFSGKMPNPVSGDNLVCNQLVGTTLRVEDNCPTEIQWFSSLESTTVLGTGISTQVSAYRNTSPTYFAQCKSQGNCLASDRIPVKAHQVENCTVCTLPAVDCSDRDVITGFTLRNASNQVVYQRLSGCEVSGFFQDWTTLPTLVGGQTYTLKIENDQSFYPEGLGVWINYASDLVWTTVGTVNPSIWSSQEIQFTVPVDVTPGQKRIRVHLQYNKLPMAPCRSTPFGGVDTFGEWEELLVYTCPQQFMASLSPDPAQLWYFQEATQTLQIQANLSTLKSKVTAGQSIELNPGFEVKSGGTFLAQTLMGCPLQP